MEWRTGLARANAPGISVAVRRELERMAAAAALTSAWRKSTAQAAVEALREVDVDILTIGQYLRPSAWHLPVVEWVSPARFAAYRPPWFRALSKRLRRSGVVHSWHTAH